MTGLSRRLPMTPASVLREAKALIAQPSQWCQGWWARDAKGGSTGWRSQDASRFCALGALSKAAGDFFPVPESDYLRRASLELYGTDVIDQVNDLREHQDILQMYDRAIELAEVDDYAG